MGSGTSNLAQLIPAYFVGPQGQQLTPEQIERQRAMAQTLLEQATDTSPNAGGWASVIAKGLQGYQAGRENRLAIDAERANAEASQKNIAAMLGGGGLTSQPSASPMTGAHQNVTAPAMSGDSGNVFNEFMGGIREQINNPFALAAIAGTGQRESAFSPQNVRRTWSDPSESGQAGTAGGIMSWRGPRYQALAATGDLSPAGQARFFLGEDPQLVANLNNAQSLEEAQTLMNNAWRFAGFNRPGGETAERIAASRGFLPQFQGEQNVDYSPHVQAAPNVSATLPAQVGAPQQPSINPAILQTLADPRSSPQARAIAQSLLQQQQSQQQFNQQQQAQRDNWLFQQNYQQQQQTNDPLRQAQIENQQLQNQALRNPQPKITDTQRNLQWRAEQAGLQPGTPEYSEFMRTGGAVPQTQVNVGAGEKAWDQESAKLFAKRYDDISAGASNAQQMMGMYDLAEQALNSGVRTGLGAESELTLRQLGAAMGMDTDPNKLSGGELIRAVQNRMALTMRSPDGGMGMPGALSDRDIKFLKDSQVGIDRSPEGNRRMLQSFRAMEQRKIQIAQLADEYVARNGRLDSGFNKEVREFANNNPLFQQEQQQPSGRSGVTRSGVRYERVD